MITKCVTFGLLLHAAFVADEIWGDMLEPDRMNCRGVLGWKESIHKRRLATSTTVPALV